MVFCKKTLSLHQKSKKRGKGACGVATLSLMFREASGEAELAQTIPSRDRERQKSQRKTKPPRKHHQSSLTKLAYLMVDSLAI